jgi:phage baseplate assembly protein W
MSTEILSDKNSGIARAQVVSRSKPYSDLDLRFKAHPNFGDVVPIKDIAAIKNSIRNILLTDYGERPFQPGLGSGITGFLFEPVSPITVALMKQNIVRALRIHEPRAQIRALDIQDRSDENAWFISLTVQLQNVSELVDVELYLERIR